MGSGLVLAGAGFVPYVGDALDVYDVARPSASAFERATGGISLAINAATLGVAPNAGPIIRGTRQVGAGAYDVYQVVDRGVVRYVGITTDFARRQAEHLRGAYSGLRIDVIEGLKGLSRFDARSAGQVLIEQYGRAQDRIGNALGGQLDNLINSVSPARDIYGTAISRGQELLRNVGLLE